MSYYPAPPYVVYVPTQMPQPGYIPSQVLSSPVPRSRNPGVPEFLPVFSEAATTVVEGRSKGKGVVKAVKSLLGKRDCPVTDSPPTVAGPMFSPQTEAASSIGDDAIVEPPRPKKRGRKKLEPQPPCCPYMPKTQVRRHQLYHCMNRPRELKLPSVPCPWCGEVLSSGRNDNWQRHVERDCPKR